MRIINSRQTAELEWKSPKGKFHGYGIQLSEALGRDAKSTDVLHRHPFDVELSRLPPGASPCPYHAHSAQWEFYHVVSGTGSVRHHGGIASVGPGDTFLFKPGEPHQILNTGDQDLVFFVIADNPIGESCFYPDSGKWSVPIPERRLVRSEALDYFDGEE